MAGIETQPVTEIAVRALTARGDLQEAVRLQQTVWGFTDTELIPLRLFVVSTHIGGQVFGAFDGERMVGFCLAIPGLKRGAKGYLHSHMLGVLPEYRNRRIGRALKLAQREEAAARSIDLIEWTFDPLEIKNAYFNIESLGAVVRRYVLNQYGTTSSRLHGSLPTDRCYAEWHLRSARVEAAIAGRSLARPPVHTRIEVPANIDALRHNAPAEARRIQAAVSERFLEAFRAGLAVIGFERGEQAGTYLLSEWHSE
jgi:predicted GNAT superfamily acetyltransferase